MFTEHFKRLFTSSNIRVVEDLFYGMQGRVTEAMNQELQKPFSREEIKKSLFEMHLAKALKVDGMQATFFQNYLDVVGDSIIVACLNFLNDGNDLNQWNHTLIALVLKVKESKLVLQYRPINFMHDGL